MTRYFHPIVFAMIFSWKKNTIAQKFTPFGAVGISVVTKSCEVIWKVGFTLSGSANNLETLLSKFGGPWVGAPPLKKMTPRTCPWLGRLVAAIKLD